MFFTKWNLFKSNILYFGSDFFRDVDNVLLVLVRQYDFGDVLLVSGKTLFLDPPNGQHTALERDFSSH